MKIIGILYGLFCYTLGVASLVAFILFANNYMGLAGYGSLNIDWPNATIAGPALVINLALVLLFGIQHSVMARPSFKAALTRVVPQNLERSTYVLATALVFFVLIYYWQPMQGSLWHVESEAARTGIAVIYFIGWAITLLATFMLNHFYNNSL